MPDGSNVAAFNYDCGGRVLADFLADKSFVRAIRGPIGSGKSVGCCIALLMMALAQHEQPQPDGSTLRKSRFVVVRNTGPQLKTTTIKTWLDWFPEDVFGKMNWTPPYTHHIKRHGLDMEVIFLAMDTPADVEKLLSLELTGGWANEARELPKAVVDGLTSRLRRYPSMKNGGCVQPGLVMDTNSPDDDHWWPIMSGEAPAPDYLTEEDLLMLQRPDNWRFFTQPAGMNEVFEGEGRNRRLTGYERNPGADNYKNLDPAYYNDLIRGKDRRWISIYVLNRLGSTVEGRPIYPSFRPAAHVPEEPLPILQNEPVYVGIDFGLTPAAVFAQRLRGRWLIQRELVTADMGAKRFAQLVRKMLVETYGRTEAKVTGDPAGDTRAQTDEETPFMVLRAAGLHAMPAHSNDFALRVDSVEEVLGRMSDGLPAFALDPACRVLRKAMESGYCYRRMQVSGAGAEARFADKPEKNRYSHIAEALQYLMLGGGEGRALIRSGNPAKPTVAGRGWKPFGQRQSGFRGTRGR
jgi:hypothetical protein